MARAGYRSLVVWEKAHAWVVEVYRATRRFPREELYALGNQLRRSAGSVPMQKSLFAVDELAGFIVACAKVRPAGIADLQPRSVKKKLRDKAFAAAVSREDIDQGIAELGVDPDQHIQRCIAAIRDHLPADQVGPPPR